MTHREVYEQILGTQAPLIIFELMGVDPDSDIMENISDQDKNRIIIMRRSYGEYQTKAILKTINDKVKNGDLNESTNP